MTSKLFYSKGLDIDRPKSTINIICIISTIIAKTMDNLAKTIVLVLTFNIF